MVAPPLLIKGLEVRALLDNAVVADCVYRRAVRRRGRCIVVPVGRAGWGRALDLGLGATGGLDGSALPAFSSSDLHVQAVAAVAAGAATRPPCSRHRETVFRAVMAPELLRMMAETAWPRLFSVDRASRTVRHRRSVAAEALRLTAVCNYFWCRNARCGGPGNRAAFFASLQQAFASRELCLWKRTP